MESLFSCLPASGGGSLNSKVFPVPRKLYVHVGPKKTGTTAIQTTLEQHDGSVVVYPQAGRGEEKSHHPLVLEFFKDRESPERLPSDCIDRMLADLSREIGGVDRPVVISCEGLETRDAGAFVDALLPLFGGAVDTEFLVAYREHFARISSWYGHRIRTKRQKGVPPSPDEYLERNARKFCYAPFLENLRHAGWRVTVLNYHPSADWVDRFLKHIGFPQDAIPAVECRNVGLSTKILIASLATKLAVRAERPRLRYLREFEKLDDARTPSKFIFGRQAASRAEEIFSTDRRYLREHFGVFAPDPQLELAENALWITPQEFTEIEAVATRFGDDGRKIMEAVRHYLRGE